MGNDYWVTTTATNTNVWDTDYNNNTFYYQYDAERMRRVRELQEQETRRLEEKFRAEEERLAIESIKQSVLARQGR